MALHALTDEVAAALARIERKDPSFSAALKKAAGYAVFPSIGRAGLLLGGAYGRGQVFARGQHIGDATVGQMTLGLQLGGQTFSEVVIFNSTNALERFKSGRVAFAANASAVMLTAAASGTTDYEKDVIVKAFARSGMLLEASFGGQVFKFRPLDGERAVARQQPGVRQPGARQQPAATAAPHEPTSSGPEPPSIETIAPPGSDTSRKKAFGRATAKFTGLFHRGGHEGTDS